MTVLLPANRSWYLVALIRETFPPQQNSLALRTQLTGMGVMRSSLGGTQSDLRPRDNPLGCRLGPNPRLPRLFLFDGHGQRVGWVSQVAEFTRTDQYCKDVVLRHLQIIPSQSAWSGPTEGE